MEVKYVYPKETEGFYLKFLENRPDKKYVSRKKYNEIRTKFENMVNDLTDGLVIDLSELERIGLELWISRSYYQKYR